MMTLLSCHVADDGDTDNVVRDLAGTAVARDLAGSAC